jgi:nicotinamidase/pyrazinamidase
MRIAAFDVVQMPYGDQVLWPDHCVQGSVGGQFHPDLNTDPAALIMSQGHEPRNRQLFGVFRK